MLEYIEKIEMIRRNIKKMKKEVCLNDNLRFNVSKKEYLINLLNDLEEAVVNSPEVVYPIIISLKHYSKLYGFDNELNFTYDLFYNSQKEVSHKEAQSMAYI